MKGISALFMLLFLGVYTSAQTVQSENFDACTLPTGWVQQVLSGSDGWLFVVNSPDIFNAGNFDGTCMALFDDDFLGTLAPASEVALLSPPIDLTAYGSVMLEFDYNFREADAFTLDSFAVDVFDGSSWVNLIGGIDDDCGDWSCGPPFPQVNVDVTPYINSNFQVRFYYNDGGASGWWFAFDNFKLTVPSTDDLAMVSINSPTVTTCATGGQTVEIEVMNVGSSPATGFNLCFEVDGPGGPFSVCENVGALTLAPGASATYTFATTADLSSGGSYDFKAYTDLAGDTELTNDTLSTTIFTSTGAYPLPTSEDFDSYPAGAVLFTGNLVNSTADDLEWEVNFGSTTSIATGPNADADGGGGYLYMESSGSVVGDQAILQTGCFDVSALSFPVLEFAYHMYGGSIDGLYVDAHTPAGTVNIFAKEGQQHGSSGSAYSDTTINLSAFAGSPINLVFRGMIQTDGGGFTYNGDIALDNIEVRDFGNDDLSATTIIRPKGEGCIGSASELVRMRITNVGIDPQTGFNVCYNFTGPTGTSSICENVGALTIPGGGGTDIYTFASTVDMSVEGNYHLQVYTALPGDIVPGNDSLAQDYSFSSTVLPISDNFASYASGVTTFSTDLTNTTSDDLDWQVNFGGTSSGGTGPSGDATGLGGYIFVESTGADSGNVARLETACIDLGTASNPKLNFSYHLYGGAIGSLSVDVQSGSASTNELLVIGQEQTSSGAAWTPVTIDLSAYIGEVVQISWTAIVGTDISGASFTSDFALDEIAVTDPLPNDLGISSVNAPKSDCSLSNAEDVIVTLENFGTTSASGFDVVYEMTGPGGTTLVSENVGALVLPAGTSVSYTFATPADLSADGVYSIKSWTEVPSDAVNGNDTSALLTENLTEITSYPYQENFDSFTNCGNTVSGCVPNTDCNGAVSGGWSQLTVDNINWSVTNFATPTSGTGPSGDHTSGGGKYLFTEASGCDGQAAAMLSPCFDLSTTVCPQLTFWYHLFGDDMGSLSVEVYDGFAWVSLWSISGNQGNAWQQAEVSLSAYAGTTVRFRIIGTTGSGLESDMAIDDFGISENGLDLAVTSVNAPTTGCSLGVETTAVSITNMGCSSAPSFDISLEVNGVVIATETAPSGLGAAASVNFSFGTPVDLSAHETYTFRVFTSLATDLNPANDTLEVAIGSFADFAVPGTGFDSSYCIGATTEFPAFTIPGGTYSGPGIVDATTGEFNPALVGPGTTDITYAVSPTEAYFVSEAAFDPETISSPVLHLLGDDDSKEIDLDFYFSFFGTYYNSLHLHSNGYVSFGPVSSTAFTPQNLPAAAAPNNLIALAWDDLDPTAGGSIFTSYAGSAPHRRFIVYFDEVPYNGSTSEVKAQLILHESTNEIEMQVFHIESDGGDRTQGIENNNGSEAYTSEAGTNLTDFTQLNQAFVYLPTLCNGSITETVVLNAGPTVALGADTALCHGESLVLDAGAGFASYLWSSGDSTQTIMVDSTNLYTVEVEDPTSFCNGSGSILVEVAEELDLSATVDDVTCFGESNGQIQVIVTGGFGAFTYDWSSGGSSATIGALGPGDYNVTITDSVGCSIEDSFSVAEPPMLTLFSLDAWNETSVGSDGQAIATPMGGTPPYTYFWSNGSTDSANTGLSAGWYYLTVTDANGCTLSDSVEILQQGVGIETPLLLETVIYPNPGSGYFQISGLLLQGTALWMEVRALNGGVVTEEYLGQLLPGPFSTEMDLSSFPAGTYLLAIKSAYGEQFVRPITIQR